MFKEFKEFAMRGSVLDLAIGVIIGGAFGKVTTSLVSDVLMPPLSLLVGKVNFSSLFINLTGQHFDTLTQAQIAGAPTLNYGLFLNTVLDFLLVSFAVFMVVRQINKLRRKECAEEKMEPISKKCPFCVSIVSLEASRCPFCTSEIPH